MFPSSGIFALLLLTGFVSGPVHASDGSTEPTDEVEERVPDRAEFVRLQLEIERLANRSAWTGVERTFRKIEETGVEPTFKMYVAAAHAARAIGDIGAARARLSAAMRDQEDKDVIDWLWDIDSNFGRASFKCTPGRQQFTLAAETMPFNPDHRRAVEFAIRQIEETCEFEGYLPEGAYVFGGFDLKIAPRVQSVSLDLRSMEPPAQKKKPRRAKKNDR